MHKRMAAVVVFVSLLAFGQASPKYQPGTITAVTLHKGAPTNLAPGTVSYDVSVKVDNTIYVVLYTPPSGAKTVEYAAGLELLVLVGDNNLTFNSRISGTTTVPILSRQVLSEQSGLDWSKTPGQYFSMKQKHLSEALGLTDQQISSIKPILLQETAEVGQIFNNPVLSREEQLKRWEKIVQSSDKKLEPYLSDPQKDKLQQLRKEQKQDLKKLAEQRGSANDSD